jgi:hypothetical protein
LATFWAREAQATATSLRRGLGICVIVTIGVHRTLSRVGRALEGAGGGEVSGARRAGLCIGKGGLGDCRGHEQKTVRWLHVFWQVSHCNLSVMVRNEAKATGSDMTRLQAVFWT